MKNAIMAGIFACMGMMTSHAQANSDRSTFYYPTKSTKGIRCGEYSLDGGSFIRLVPSNWCSPYHMAAAKDKSRLEFPIHGTSPVAGQTDEHSTQVFWDPYK